MKYKTKIINVAGTRPNLVLVAGLNSSGALTGCLNAVKMLIIPKRSRLFMPKGCAAAILLSPFIVCLGFRRAFMSIFLRAGVSRKGVCGGIIKTSVKP